MTMVSNDHAILKPADYRETCIPIEDAVHEGQSIHKHILPMNSYVAYALNSSNITHDLI